MTKEEYNECAKYIQKLASKGCPESFISNFRYYVACKGFKYAKERIEKELNELQLN